MVPTSTNETLIDFAAVSMAASERASRKQQIKLEPGGSGETKRTRKRLWRQARRDSTAQSKMQRNRRVLLMYKWTTGTSEQEEEGVPGLAGLSSRC